MSGRLLDALSTVVTERRRWVVASVAVFTAVAAFYAKDVEVDPSPKSLVTSYEDQREATDLLVDTFGNSDHVIVILVEAPDVLAPEVLSYLHGLSSALSDTRVVTRVESLTDTALAARIRGDDSQVTLEDLENEPAQETPADVIAALDRLIAADPGRFPDGLTGISERGADVRVVNVGADGHIDDADVNALRAALEDAPLLEGKLVGPVHEDGKRHVAAIIATIEVPVHDYDALVHAAETVEGIVAAHVPPSSVQVHVGGLPSLWIGIVKMLVRDQFVLVPLTLMVCLALLYGAFRSVTASLLVISTVGIFAIILVGGMAFFGEPLNILTNIIPALLIITGVCEAIHLVGRFREELDECGSRVEAARRMVRATAVPSFLTALTTAIGLGSVLTSHTEMLKRFGVAAAIGVMIAYVVTILFLPAALALFRGTEGRKRAGGGQKLLEHTMERSTRWVLAHPRRVVASTLVFCALAAWAGTTLTMDTSLLDQFETDDPLYRTTRVMERELDGVHPLECVLVAKDGESLATPEVLNSLARIARWAESQDGVLRATEVGDFLREARYLLTDDEAARSERFRNADEVAALVDLVEARSRADGSTNPVTFYLSPDRKMARLQIRIADVGAKRTIAIIDATRARLERGVGAHADVHLTGDAFTGSVPIDSVARDMVSSLGTAVILIFAMLLVIFRSVRLGAIAILPNAFPLFVAAGWMALRDIPLTLGTAIIFSISIGLSDHGTVHFVARFQEERAAGHTLEQAVLRSVRGTGHAFLVSCAVLLCGFFLFVFSSFVPIQQLGELVAVTIVGSVVATLVLQPALMKLWADKRTPRR
jgi:predicted RND superfamily exporter protein